MKDVYIGIDLGTTNSSIASFDGEALSVIQNSSGEILTPSVVRIDLRGNIAVGRRAIRFLDSDPENTCREFKRLMGTDVSLSFKASEKKLLPEDLSAKVLESLLADAADSLGYSPKRVVISTPALFDLPQNHATMRAGKLAGLEEVILIQEPIASAIAAGWKAESEGLWLIYDLGGGTLDISLLETKDGWLRVVDHSGDNFLGGKDFDSALVDWSVVKLQELYGIQEFNRANPATLTAFNRLKVACEQAKIELSRIEHTTITLPQLCITAGGEEVEVDLPVSRVEYEAMIETYIMRSLSVCRKLLEKNRVSADDVSHVVFVGGPTLTPAIRKRVGDFFGGRVAQGIDPMTIVARGAALYAATSGLSARQHQESTSSNGGLAVKIEYPPVTADLMPFVVGRFMTDSSDKLPARTHIVRNDGSFTSSDAIIGTEGTFILQVELVPHRQNNFSLVANHRDGTELLLSTPNFAIVHGVSVSDPPLSKTVGVALSDNSVHVYFKKGTALPARKTFSHQTIRSVSAGDIDDVLNIPIIQGDFSRAHRNGLIGTLCIGGLERNLNSGSTIEVTLHLDRSGQLHARADIVAIGQTFENVVHILVPTASLSTLEKETESTKKRLANIQRRAFKNGDAAMIRGIDQAPLLLVEALRALEAARGGDADAVQRLNRLLLEINAELDSVEASFEWPELVDETNERISIALGWVAEWGTPAEQKLLDQAIKTATSAYESNNSLELDRQLRMIRTITNAAYVRDPQWLHNELQWYERNISNAIDIVRATELIRRGRNAADHGDKETLRDAVKKLYPLFPGSEEERQRSFDSGVY